MGVTPGSTRTHGHAHVSAFVAAVIGLAAQYACALDLSQWHLVFSDEFNDTTVNWSAWTLGEPWVNAPQNPYLNVQANCSESGGVIRFRGDQKGADGKFHTGGITSQQKFGYGYFEARFKIPKGQGMWPAFWLLNWYSNPEIDIMENLGDDPTVMYCTLQQMSSGNQFHTSGLVDYSQAFHVFGCAWYADSIVMYIDSTRFCHWNSTANPWQWWGTAATMNVILNLQVGGDWPGLPDSTTPFPGYYDVDYIRVYQPGPATVAAPTTAQVRGERGAHTLRTWRESSGDVVFAFAREALAVCLYGLEGIRVASLAGDAGGRVVWHTANVPSGRYAAVATMVDGSTLTGVIAVGR